MSKITWYDKPQRFTVTLVPRSTLSYDEALARIAELEAANSQNGHQTREQAKDLLRAVHASVAATAAPTPRPAKPRAARKPAAPLDDSVTAVVLRAKMTEDGQVTHYVKAARKASDTWYPVWSSLPSAAAALSYEQALDLVGWLKRSRTVDRSYTFSLEKIDA